MEYQSVVLKEVPVNIPVVHQELVSVIPQVPIESVATMILMHVENGVVLPPVVRMRSVRMDTVNHHVQVNVALLEQDNVLELMVIKSVVNTMQIPV